MPNAGFIEAPVTSGSALLERAPAPHEAPGRPGHRNLGRLAAVLGMVAALAAFWQLGVRPNVFPKRFGVVAEGRVYRSGKLTPGATRLVVERHHIRTIVDLGSWEPGSPEDRLAARTADALNVVRFRFDLVGDATGNPNAYVQALRIMTDPARQPVLVHCGAGTERTGCAVVLYRTIVEGVARDEALREAGTFGHDDGRNPKFVEVLDRWAPAIERAFREGGSIPGADPLPEPRPSR